MKRNHGLSAESIQQPRTYTQYAPGHPVPEAQAGAPAPAYTEPMPELERPTTFQLAQLAAILATRPDSVRISPTEVVLEALQLWDAAFKANATEQQERAMWQGIFHDHKNEWEQRLKSYVGDKTGLYEMLSEPRFQVENEVLPNIFPDKRETEASRREKFSSLIHYAQEHQHFSWKEPIHPELQRADQNQELQQLQQSPDGGDLLSGKLNALSVRTLVEAQQEKNADSEHASGS